MSYYRSYYAGLGYSYGNMGGLGYSYGCGCSSICRLGWGSGYGDYGFGSGFGNYRYGRCCPSYYGGYGWYRLF